NRFPPGLAHRLPPAAERRLGARRLPPPRAPSRVRAREASRDRCLRAPAQAAGELARARRACEPCAGGRGAGRDRARAVRPRRGARTAGVRRAHGGARRVNRAPATAKLNLALVVGPQREDGRHEVATVLQRLDLADRVSIEPSPELRVDGFADDTLVRDALTALAATAGVDPAWRAR